MATTTAPLSETDYTRISCAAAETFTEAYYTALDSSRLTLTTFYIPAVTSPRPLPHISYNGDVLNDSSLFQSKFSEMPWTHHEVQSYNVHVMNRCLEPVEGKTRKELERNMSLAVQVSGYVRLLERKEGPMRGFSDFYVLVPGKSVGGKAEGREWVIQTQNFRFVT